MHRAQLRALLRGGADERAAFALFDQLAPVRAAEMTGLWRGYELPTGHPMDGMLRIVPWYGKQFLSPEAVHPLVFIDRAGKRYCVDPDKVMRYAELAAGTTLLKRYASGEKRIDPHHFDLACKAFRTTESRARLREIRFRGKVSAAMLYDHLAITDVFRRVDDRTLLGVMDLKGKFHGAYYFFVLRKVN